MRRMRRMPRSAWERTTRQREAILDAIESDERPLDPTEVLERARKSVNSLGLATVYRNLKVLVSEGVLRAVSLPGDSPRYEMAHSPHHHHFQCTSCSRVFDVPGCPGNLRHLAPRGFRVDHHDVTLYGCCSDCGKREARAAR